MSLDDITAEAIKAGLGTNEIETAKRQYWFGILHYETINPQPDFSRFRTALHAIHHHRISAEYCGEAYARKYIRETSSRTSHDNERSIRETAEANKGTRQPNRPMGTTENS